MNLVINARDAMPDGGTITISTDYRTVEGGSDLAEGRYVIVKVEDRGTGIPPEIIDKVLEPFFTTKPIGKGTGLGLSMVYGFARQSGGTFRLSGAEPNGTIAEIWLPEAAEHETFASAEDEAISLAGPSLNILVVDDHPEVRMTTVALLEDLGHKVIQAESGNEALELLQGGEAIDLLLSDYAMPHLSGTELVRLVRKDHPKLPAVLITGYADAEQISNRPRDVMILNKPFSLPALSSAVTQAMLARDSGADRHSKAAEPVT
jgi:CheY-like chemotaxis protein